MGDVFGAIGGKVLQLLVPIVAPLIAGLVTGVLMRQFKRLGLVLTEQEEARLRELVRDAVIAIEEMSRRTKMSPDQKRLAATDLVRASMPKANPARVDELIHAALPDMRARVHPVPITPGTFGR